MKKIRTFEELLHMSSDGEYELACDIDCENKAIKCIIDEFDGVLDGRGHAIKNLHIRDKVVRGEQEVAPIRRVRYARIVNISFDNVFIDIDASPYSAHIATLIADAEASTLENVQVSTNNDVPMVYISYNTRYDNVRYNSTNKMVKEIID